MFKVKPNKLTEKLKPLDNQLNRNDVDEPLPHTKSIIWIIVGSKGRGKTSLLINTLKTKDGGYKKFFDNIYLFSPTGKSDTKIKKLVNELEEDNKYYDEFNEENMNDVFDKIKAFNQEYKEENPNSTPHNLIIFDDCLSDLPKSMEKSSLNRLIPNARHHNTYLIFLVQRYVGCNRLIRSQPDLISFFRSDNRKELEALTDDVNIDKDKLIALYKFATDDDPNGFLHINLLTRKFYKKFDEILIN